MDKSIIMFDTPDSCGECFCQKDISDIVLYAQKEIDFLSGNILATVHQKANGNYVIEIKIGHIVSEILINSVKFCCDGAEFE